MTISKERCGGLSPKLFIGELLFFLLMVAILYVNPTVTESSYLENVQVVVLFVGMVISLHAYARGNCPDLARPFFLLLFLLLMFCLIRELSYGRVFYYDESYAVTPEMKRYYKSLPLVRGLRALAYGALVMMPLYFLYQKLYLSVVPLLRKLKLYWLDVFCLSASLALVVYAERCLLSTALEESAELFFYLCIVNIAWKYARNQGGEWGAASD